MNNAIDQKWGKVALLCGTTDEQCERCKCNDAEVFVRTRDDKDHGFCKECLGIIVEK